MQLMMQNLFDAVGVKFSSKLNSQAPLRYQDMASPTNLVFQIIFIISILNVYIWQYKLATPTATIVASFKDELESVIDSDTYKNVAS